MKFVVVNGIRREAEPDLLGSCPGCGGPMIARCGNVKVWHWAHRGKRNCDLWWENETEWHRGWKNCFPFEWQEVIHHAASGEKHIADVKTEFGYVLEFQHSFLKAEERQAREEFYEKLIWVVDGTRLKRDKKKFSELLNRGMRFNANVPILRLSGYLDECALLRDWAGSRVPVFFDFGDDSIWYLVPGSTTDLAHVVKFSRAYFTELNLCGATKNSELEFWFTEIGQLIATYIANLRASSQSMRRPPVRTQSFRPRIGRSRRRL